MIDGRTLPPTFRVATARALAALLAGLLLFLAVGCDDDLTIYYPMSEGRNWRYRVSIVHDGSTLSAEALVANLPSAEVNGRLGVPQRSDLFGHTVVRYLAESRDGIVEFAQQAGEGEPVTRDPPDYVLKIPLVAGTSWSSTWQSTAGGAPVSFPTVKAIAAARETVMVPAGTFADCLRVRITGKTEAGLPKETSVVEVLGEEWYAPGIGFIKGSFKETINHGESTSALEMNLESYRAGD